MSPKRQEMPPLSTEKPKCVNGCGNPCYNSTVFCSPCWQQGMRVLARSRAYQSYLRGWKEKLWGLCRAAGASVAPGSGTLDDAAGVHDYFRGRHRALPPE